MIRITKIILKCLFIFAILLPVPYAGAVNEPDAVSNDASIALTPNIVDVNFFFREAEISFNSRIPSGCDAVLLVKGKNHQKKMGIQGRRCGLWMTVGTATFKNAPAFYRCFTSKPIADITSKENAVSCGMGYEKIKNEIASASDGKGVEKKWIEQFVEYQKKTDIFSIREGAIKISDNRDGTETVTGTFVIPAWAPKDYYNVTLFGFKNQLSVVKAEKTLLMEYTPSIAFIYNLAMNHGWIYGITAVIIALVAGIGVGTFSSSKGAH